MICARIISVLLVVFAVAYPAGAQIRIIPKERLDSIANPPLAENSAYIRFREEFIDAGIVEEDSGNHVFRYEFCNKGCETVRISRLVSTCSCLSVTCPDPELASGESGMIEARYNPKGHPGRFERRIFVYTDDNSSPTAVLKLAIHVENADNRSASFPIQMGTVRVKKREIDFGRSVSSSESIRFLNLTGKSLELKCDTDLLPGCLSVEIKPGMVPDGEEGEIVVSYDAGMSLPVSGKAMIVFKGLGVPPSQSALIVNFLND